jgi:hypothetical protein
MCCSVSLTFVLFTEKEAVTSVQNLHLKRSGGARGELHMTATRPPNGACCSSHGAHSSELPYWDLVRTILKHLPALAVNIVLPIE